MNFKMSFNMKSLGKGISITVGFSIAWLLLARLLFGLEDPVSLAMGILAIVFAVGIAGFFNVPLQHKGVRKVLGKRVMEKNKQFDEGAGYNAPWESVETVNAKDKMIDIPVFTVKSKNGVPMEVDIAIYYAVVAAADYLNIEEVERRLTKRAKEAARAFIISHTDKQCEGAEGDVQSAIEEMIDKRTREKCGVNITGIDVERMEPVKEIFDEYKLDKQKHLRTSRYVKSMKRIKNAAPGISDDTLANTAQIVEGIVKKEIKEQKTTFKLDLEPEVIEKAGDVISRFLPKKKGDKK